MYKEAIMSDNVQIVLIIVAALVIVLFIFRKQLSDFRFKGGKEGVDMQLKTRKDAAQIAPGQPGEKQAGTSVNRNKLWGKGNEINLEGTNASVDENQLIGEEQKINVKSGTKKGK
jgi:hypothetical protein